MKLQIVKSLRTVMAVAVLFCSYTNILAWSQKGHDVTAAIAENHLTPATRAAVDSLLEGRSMIYWANWLDNASHQPEMKYTKTWHYKNIDDGVRYEEAPANPAGDVVTAIRAQVETLSDPKSTFAQSQLALKILVHLLGDIHQPMHMGHATDLGGNRVKVRFFGREQNLHSIWDGSIPESAHKWSYSEWRDQLDRISPERQSLIVAGSVDDWAKQTHAIASDVYTAMPEGTKVSYDEVAHWAPVIEEQFLNGGLRLAHLLNTIFDPSYAAAH